MSAVSVPSETEHVLLYLLVTHLRSARTLPALRSLCTDDEQIDDILTWLVDSGYVYEDDCIFELTFSGVNVAKQLQTLAQGKRLDIAHEAPTSVRQPKAQTQTLPTLEAHPMRAGAEHPHHPDSTCNETLRYVLASECPRNILPIPVLSGDVLGRLADVDISLPYDEYLSSEHCRFTLSDEAGQTTLHIEDLGSRNGTQVNGFQLDPGRLFTLEHGDRIHVGSTVLIVVKIPC